MKKLILAAALMAALPFMAQTVQKGSSEKNPPDSTANFVDYTTSHAAGTILHAPCGASGAAVNPWTVPDNNCFQAWLLPLGAQMTSTYTYVADEFLTTSSINGLALRSSGTGAGGTTGVSDASHPGIFACDVGTAAGPNICQLQSGSGTTVGQMVIFGGGRWEMGVRAHVEQLSTAGETYTARIGFQDGNGAEATDGAFFRYTHSVNGGKWECVTISNTTPTADDSGVAAQATTFDTFVIKVNAAATSVDFYINGNLVKNHTTNIPSGAARATGVIPISLVKTASAGGDNRMDIDSYYVYAEFTTPR